MIRLAVMALALVMIDALATRAFNLPRTPFAVLLCWAGFCLAIDKLDQILKELRK